MRFILKIALIPVVAIIISFSAVSLYMGNASCNKDTHVVNHEKVITDMTGRKVHIPASPARILSMCTAVTGIAVRLGGANRIMAVDEYGAIVPGIEKEKITVKGGTISKESLLGKKINLAFIWWYQNHAAQILEELNIPFVKFKSVRAGTIPEMIKVTGCCLGFQKKATRLAEDTSAYISQLERKNSSPAEKTSVYLETYSPFKTCGSFTFADDIIKLAGAKNVASDTKGSVIISPEKILEEKPDIIIYIKGFANYKEISSRSALKTLNAVKNKQIYGIDRYLLTAGADIRQSVRKIQKIIDTGKKKHNAIP